MKVLLVGGFDLKFHPYSKKYIEILEENHIDFDFIYWNRSGEKVENKPYFLPFNYDMNTYQSKYKKIAGYFKFKKFVLTQMKNNRYDKVVFFTTQVMFMFSSFAKKNKNYLFDYRDETFEKNSWYRKIIARCINDSKLTVVSSKGFLKLFDSIDESKVVLCHNDKLVYPKLNEEKLPYENQVINLSFWGMIRQVDYLEKICSFFGNDKRYHLSFYGEGYYLDLKKYLEANHIENVDILGPYSHEQIPGFVKSTNVLLNAYSNQSIQKQSLTVKLYDAIHYDLPMIVQKDSYMENYLKEYSCNYIAIDFDHLEESSKLKDQIYVNIKKVLNDKLNYQELGKQIKNDGLEFEKKVKGFILEEI